MRGRPRHCRATQPTPQPLPPRSGQAFPPGLHQVGLAVHLCDGRWPCVQGHHGICRGHLLRTPAPLLCSARLRQCAGLTLCRPLRRQEAEQPRQPLVWKSLCWGRVQYLSNLLLRGPLMGSIRSAWHSEALLCPWGPPGGPVRVRTSTFRPSRQKDRPESRGSGWKVRGRSPRARWGKSPMGSGQGAADQQGSLSREMPGALEEGWRAAGGFAGTCWGAEHQPACPHEGLGVPRSAPDQPHWEPSPSEP